jgi:hypothetical protein
MIQPSLRVTRELIRMACCAPSIHNTQPWKWHVVGPAAVELYADRGRQLATLDPRGRSLAISCGASLHQLSTAAEAFGVHAEATLLPDRQNPDLLAVVRLTPGDLTRNGTELLAALEDRRTDRRGFTDGEVPQARLAGLAEETSIGGPYVVPVADAALRVLVERLVERARTAQRMNERAASEQDAWIERGTADGIPVGLAEPTPRDGVAPRPDRFNRRSRQDASSATGTEDDPAGDVPVLICTTHDDQKSWLEAGQVLSTLWVRATRGGLSVVPDSQVIENDATRRLLRQALPDPSGQPQLLVRVGWQESSRPRLAASPRRDLRDVLTSG